METRHRRNRDRDTCLLRTRSEPRRVPEADRRHTHTALRITMRRIRMPPPQKPREKCGGEGETHAHRFVLATERRAGRSAMPRRAVTAAAEEEEPSGARFIPMESIQNGDGAERRVGGRSGTGTRVPSYRARAPRGSRRERLSKRGEWRRLEREREADGGRGRANEEEAEETVISHGGKRADGRESGGGGSGTRGGAERPRWTVVDREVDGRDGFSLGHGHPHGRDDRETVSMCHLVMRFSTAPPRRVTRGCCFTCESGRHLPTEAAHVLEVR